MQISSADAFPKLICHQCLSSIIIASSIKRKSLETDKIFQEISIGDEDLYEQFSDDEPILVEADEAAKNKYLVYEEDNETDNQPKMNFSVNSSTTKIRNLSHFNYNPELKSFIQDYMEANKNLEIIKVTDPHSIQDIERVVSRNEDAKHFMQAKRQRLQDRARLNSPITQPSSSRLLSALSGRRLNQLTVNRINSAAFNIVERKRN